MKSVIYFKHDFCHPWGMQIPKGNFAQFHVVIYGRCLLKVEHSIDPIPLYGGDLVIFPHGQPHRLLDDINNVCLNGKEVVESIQNGVPIFENGTVSSTLICGHYELDRNIDHPFLQSLPDMIHLKKQDHEGNISWLEMITKMLLEETHSNRPGTLLIRHRLAEVLFITAIRSYLKKTSSDISFLSALKDHRIHQSLCLMHSDLQKAWSIERLARACGMSRTLFANRFREVVGQTPMTYLSNWRLLQAKILLENKEISMSEVADNVGYQSTAAFNRAFKKKYLISPGKFQRE